MPVTYNYRQYTLNRLVHITGINRGRTTGKLGARMAKASLACGVGSVSYVIMMCFISPIPTTNGIIDYQIIDQSSAGALTPVTNYQ